MKRNTRESKVLYLMKSHLKKKTAERLDIIGFLKSDRGDDYSITTLPHKDDTPSMYEVKYVASDHSINLVRDLFKDFDRQFTKYLVTVIQRIRK